MSAVCRQPSHAAMVVLVVAALVSACGGPAPSSSTAPTELTVLEWQPKRAQVIEGLIPGFEAAMAAAGTPIDVQLEALDLADGDFRTEIEARYEAGEAPDVTSYPTAWVPDLAAAGNLADLGPFVGAWSDWTEHVYPILRERATAADGRIWGVPRGATVIQLFYRRDVLTERGISTEQPASWAALVERMVALRDRMDRPPILIPAGRSWGGGTFDEGFINLMLGTRSELYDEPSGRWVVRSPGLAAVFGLYETLTRERLLPVAPLLEADPWEPTKYQTFPDGDLAVVTQGTWGWRFDWGPEGRRPIPDLDDRVSTWAFPTEAAGEPFVWAAEAWAWTITAASRVPDAAWSFIRHLSTGAALAADLVAVGNLSPRDDIAEVAPYRDEPHLVADERLIPIGRSFTPRPGIDRIQAAIGEVTEGIITGALTAEAAADRFEQLATEALGAARVVASPGG
jgi:ABC-type glycerol-3-phosphate transport system substrate-binding protein